jgi:shikimate dehydrogenase
MTDRYAVFGNPIGHSKSPAIHAEFARQTGQDLIYAAILAPIAGFAASMHAFQASGGKGANVTVPFKEEAYRLSTRVSRRAEAAGAVNTLSFADDAIVGDNTDGAGLVHDLVGNLGFPVRGKRILLMGAGGAARGVILPLLGEQPTELVIVNRTADKAVLLRDHFMAANLRESGERLAQITACGYAALAGQHFDVAINATAASLAGDLPPLPDDIFTPGALAYDMMYGQDTPFLAFARQRGVQVADGLGMLVEQAAEAFYVWRGIRPQTGPVIRLLRSQ